VSQAVRGVANSKNARRPVIVSASTWLVQPSVFAQHETAADLLDGERAYQATGANCHGPDGDVVAGIRTSRRNGRLTLL